MRRTGIIAASVLLLVMAGVYLLTSESGLRLLAHRLLPDSMDVSALHGSLAGPVHLEDATYEQADLFVKAKRVEFDWNLVETMLGIEPLTLSDAKVIDVVVTHGDAEWRVDQLETDVTVLDGVMTASHFAARSGASSITGKGRVGLPSAGDADWQATLDATLFDPADVRNDWPAMQLAGNAELVGVGTNIKLDGIVSIPEWIAEPITVSGDLRRGDGRLGLDLLTIGLEETAMRIDVSGEVQLLPGLLFDLVGDWRNVGWSDDRIGAWHSPEGEFSIAGSIDNYSGTVMAPVRRTAGGMRPIDSNLSARFSGTATRLQFNQLVIAIADGRVVGGATLDWQAAPTLVADYRGSNLDPGIVFQELDGSVSVAGSIDVQLSDTGPIFRLRLESIDGVVNSRPVSGSMRAETAADGMQTGIDVRVGAGRIVADGLVGNRLDLGWRIDAPELSGFVPGVAGRLQSEGRISGHRNAPRVDLVARGENLEWRDVAAGKLDARIQFDVSTGALGDSRITLDDVVWRRLPFEQVNAGVQGSLGSHVMTGSLVAADGSAQWRAEGSFEDSGWTGRVDTLASDSELIGRWVLEEPVSLEVVADGFVMERACFADSPARFCVAGAWSAARPWWFEADANSVSLSHLTRLLPSELDYAGRVTAKARFRGAPDSAAIGEATLGVTAASATMPGENQPILTMERGSAVLSAGYDRAAIVGGLDFGDQGRIEANIETGRGSTAAPVDGHVRGSLSGLRFLTLLYPELLDASGDLDFDVVVGGTVSDPAYRGDLSLVGGTATIAGAGITLEDIGLEIDGDSTRLDVTGAASSGDGRVQLNGSAYWSDGLPTGEFALSGTRFRLFELPQVVVDASPDLTLTMEGLQLGITGNLHIDRARIQALDLAQAVRPSPDEVIIGAVVKEPRRWRVSSHIVMTLGNDISVDAYGLSGSVRGALEIVDLPGTPATGTGELAVTDGVFKAYGQTLDIERGRLSFGGGPLGNPQVDVRAERRFEAITAGVRVRGQLRNPDVSVFSNPPRPRQYALALLVMGASPVELGRVSDSMSYGGAADQFDKSVGLGDSSSSGLGTYLSPDYYLAYLEQFNLRWRLSRKWIIEVSRGIESSIGVVYLAR